MGRKKRWKSIEYENGVSIKELSSWKYFGEYINQVLLNYHQFIYRGQGNSNWLLEPSLDRVIKSQSSYKRKDHLEKFKYATRGRRGLNPPILETEYDWWALGQHHGLKTPLLDWTESPFVALYFGAISALELETEFFAVFAFYQSCAQQFSDIIKSDDSIKKINGRKPTVKIINPLSHENNRLTSQRALFTRSPNNMDLETWVKKFKPNSTNDGMYLIKFIIPNRDIQECLKYLNRMNINHSTLFPDIDGASEFCNNHLLIKDY